VIIIYGYQETEHRTVERNASIVRKKPRVIKRKKKEEGNNSVIEITKLDL
jgi:hypothetical protein